MKMRSVIVLAVLALTCSALNETDAEVSEPSQKQGAGEGHRYGGGYNNHHHHHRRQHYHHPLVDDFVCDIDASILIVTQVKQEKEEAGKEQWGGEQQQWGQQMEGQQQWGQQMEGQQQWGPPKEQQQWGPPKEQQQPWGQQKEQRPWGEFSTPASVWRGKRNAGFKQQTPVGQFPQQNYGQGKGYEYKHHHTPSPNADRLRCSGIAYTSLEDCQVCCKLAARHDQSFSKHDVVGFLIDFNQLDFDGSSPFPTLAGQGFQSPYAAPNAPPSDSRCICCAPKRKVYYRRHHHHHDSGYGHGY